MSPRDHLLGDTRVMLLSTQPNWGGGETYLLTLANGLRERGVDVQLMARSGGVLADRARAADFVVHTLKGRGLQPRELYRLRGLLSKKQRTILHCNDTHAFRCASMISIGRKNTRIVTMRHTMFPLRSPFRYRVMANQVICVSNPVAKLCQSAGIPSEKISVVHAGLERPICDPVRVARLRQELLPDDKHKLIVAVGNLLPCKGHATLVKATARLKEQGVLVRTVIAGEGEQREPLQELIHNLGVDSNVRLLGFRTDANDLIAAADVFANPSEQEGLCLVVATAMMLDRPIVSTSVGGLTDVVQAGPPPDQPSLAAIAPPNAPARWAKELSNLLTCIPVENQLRKAREHALAKFTVGPMTDGTLNVYADLWAKAA